MSGSSYDAESFALLEEEQRVELTISGRRADEMDSSILWVPIKEQHGDYAIVRFTKAQQKKYNLRPRRSERNTSAIPTRCVDPRASHRNS